MENIIVNFKDDVPNGSYKASKTLTAIEDPRKAKFNDDKIMKASEWKTKTIYPSDTFHITGNFKYRNKTWYLIETKDKHQMVINHIVMINAILKFQY